MLILAKKINEKVDIMNRKISAICFIFLFFFLICAASAANNENETVKSIDSTQDFSKLSVEKVSETLEANKESKLTSKSVKKENVSLTAPNIKMHYKDGSKFTVTLKDKNKKAIQKAKVKISINGKSYEKTTNSKGKCFINLNLNSGTYSVLTSFAGTNKYNPQSLKSTVTIKSTIKSSDFSKYYKNKAAYFATFYNKKGKLLKNSSVKFKLNSKTYSVKTNAKGVAKLAIDLKPGKYSISAVNTNTSESVSKTVTIKSLIVSSDLTIAEGKTAKFNVKILNSYGKASPNKKVKITVNGKSYTKTTDKNGTVSLDINLKEGKYPIITEYNGIKTTNQITVYVIKKTEFTHMTLIPNYVNITVPFVFRNAYYSLKEGAGGIIKMPKSELLTVQVGSNIYYLSTSQSLDKDIIEIGYKTYFIPFNGSGIISNIDKDKLKGDGILISKIANYTKIECRITTSNNTELFGFYADKGGENSEVLTYMKNDQIIAKISIQTTQFDETGVRYSLLKHYYTSSSANYDELTRNEADKIKFANTNTPVTLSYFRNHIMGYIPKEEIITKFIINGQEELEKIETITYGFGDKYRRSLGFEVLQSYAIINEKITRDNVEYWVLQNSKYLDRFGVMNVYGMFLASLETVWIADGIADNYSKEFNVTWNRGHTLTILGGINLEDTYLNILNADMGMNVSGNKENVMIFRLLNSLNLPNIEDYSLSEVSKRFTDNSTNSLENVLTAISNSRFSIVQLGEMIYIFTEDGTNSSIIYNTTNGIANVILSHDNATYKGSKLPTCNDCCSVGIIPKDIINGIINKLNIINNDINYITSNLQHYSFLIYLIGKELLKPLLTGASAVVLDTFSTMILFQTIGTSYRTNIADEKDWYSLMDTVTFTRPGYLQNKKVYNIPNKNGGYDYVEVKINSDLTLDRTNAIYISNGKTKRLSKEETYKYFTDDHWTPFSMPTKYWDKSWKGILK